ncbi:MAG: 23S rRNA (uridine2552-2'-O)-methyltransferase [Rickettsiales bacterium]|jgi:23S rRNA (uridine2552-2'-O)-methyltransferase
MRNKFTAVKTAKRRKKSSVAWIKRHINDPFVKEAQEQGFRARSAFKIIEINNKFKIFKKGKIVVDLGAAPGGWSQVVVEKVGRGKVFAVDLLAMDAISGVEFLQQDFLSPDAAQNIINLMNKNKTLNEETTQRKCNVVLSDMAENSCGDARTDHLRIVALLEEALDFACQILEKDGVFVGKIFQGGASRDLLERFRCNFATVKHFKPDSSRKESAESYVVATGFIGSPPLENPPGN